MPLIQPYSLFTGSLADWIATVALGGLVALTICYLLTARGHDLKRYSLKLAWLRAGSYFCAGLLLSWSLGVLHSLLSTPLITNEQLTNGLWIAYTLFTWWCCGWAI